MFESDNTAAKYRSKQNASLPNAVLAGKGGNRGGMSSHGYAHVLILASSRF